MTESTAGTEAPAPPGVALVDAACKASSLVWVAVAGRPGRPAWHEWSDGRCYVVSSRDPADTREQVVPGLPDAAAAEVSVRGDKQGRVVTWRAGVTHLAAGSPEWDAAVALLRPKRLNETDLDAVPARWAERCDIAVLTPTGELIEGPDRYRDESGAMPPPASPATTVTAKPYVIGRRARRRPHL